MLRNYFCSASIFLVLFAIVRASDATRYSYHNDVTAAPTNTTSGFTSYPNNGGFCPNSLINAASCAAVQCLACNDSSCTGGQKCCSVGCCPVCTTLLPKPAPAQKAGSCPIFRNDGECSPAATNTCQNDVDCSADIKCCYSGCNQACVPPETSSQSKSGVKQKKTD